MVNHRHRLVILAGTHIAQFTVLLTHVGVIVVRAYKFVSLLSSCHLRATLSGNTKYGQSQLVAVVKLLLNRAEVAVSIIVQTLHKVITAQTSRSGECVSPAIVLHTRGVGEHQSVAILTICRNNTCTQTLTHLRGTSEDVGSTVHTTHTNGRGTHVLKHILIAGSLVQTSPERPGSVTAHCIVHIDTVQIYALSVRRHTARHKAQLTKLVACNARKYIRRGGERRGSRLTLKGLAIEFNKEGIVNLTRHRSGTQSDEVYILHLHIDLHVDSGGLEVGSLHHQTYGAIRDTIKLETTLSIGVGHTLRSYIENYFGSIDGLTTNARDNLTANTTLLCQSSHSCQGQKEHKHQNSFHC